MDNHFREIAERFSASRFRGSETRQEFRRQQGIAESLDDFRYGVTPIPSEMTNFVSTKAVLERFLIGEPDRAHMEPVHDE